MPGRASRAACSSIISAARSVTARCAASFCRTHALPPMCASKTFAPLPPTYFCTSSIFAARHVDLRAAVVLQLQVLFGPAILLQQSQPAIAADAVRHVHDEVALAQLEKAVDRPRLPPPRRPGQDPAAETARPRSPARPAAAQSGSRPPNARRRKCKPALAGRATCRRLANNCAAAARISASVSQTTNTSWPSLTLSSSSRTLRDLAAEPLDRFELQDGPSFPSTPTARPTP